MPFLPCQIKGKGKGVYIVEISPVGSADFTLITRRHWNSTCQCHLPGAQFSAAVAIFILLIFVPPGTHYCWMDTGGMDSQLLQMTSAVRIRNHRRMQHFFLFINFRSTWYPLLQVGQRRCGFIACSRFLHMASAAGIE